MLPSGLSVLRSDIYPEIDCLLFMIDASYPQAIAISRICQARVLLVVVASHELRPLLRNVPSPAVHAHSSDSKNSGDPSHTHPGSFRTGCLPKSKTSAST